MLRVSGGIEHYRFEIGAHHRPNPRSMRMAPEFIRGASLAAKALP
jgi:hypothetical protein